MRRRAPLLCLLLAAACSHLPPSWLGEPDPAAGDRLYLRACASCHGADARGGGPVAPTLSVPPTDLTTLASRHEGEFPRRYVIDVIAGREPVRAHGTREMPVWSDHFGSDLGTIAAIHASRRAALLADHLQALQR